MLDKHSIVTLNHPKFPKKILNIILYNISLKNDLELSFYGSLDREGMNRIIAKILS